MDIKLAERLLATVMNQIRAIGQGFALDLDLPMTALVAQKTTQVYQSPWRVIRGPNSVNIDLEGSKGGENEELTITF